MHSNQPGATHAVSEFDNPRNKPDMGKGQPKSHKPKVESVEQEPEVKLGRKAARRQRIPQVLAQAKRRK